MLADMTEFNTFVTAPCGSTGLVKTTKTTGQCGTRY